MAQIKKRFVYYGIAAGIICCALLVFPQKTSAFECWKGSEGFSPPGDQMADFVYKCCDFGLSSSPTPDKYNACIGICGNLPPAFYQEQGWGERFEKLCCKLLPLNTPITPCLGCAPQYPFPMTPAYEDLQKKCQEARTHTGTGACFLKEDRPDRLAKDCCSDKKENTVQGGKACDIVTYSGKDECKPDSKFLCCLCVDPADSSKTFYLPGSFNCKMCRDECKNSGPKAGIPNAVPYYDKLPYTENSCAQTAENFSGPAKSTQPAIKERRQEPLDMFCFTAAQCAKESGDASNFKLGQGCPMKGTEKQGRCKAPEPDYNLQYPVLGVTTIRGLRSYIGLMFKAAIGLMIVLSAVFFMWGAFKYIVSSVAKNIEKSKSMMVDALVGLVLGLGAYTILANINPYTLQIKKLDIDMINKMSFFNVVFCNNITPPPKLSDAGTVIDPKSYSKSLEAGFTTEVKAAKCGREYFIDGGDSTSICSGEECDGKGVCVSCAAGISMGCKTTSYREFSCSDAQMAGTVIAPSGNKPKNIYAMMAGTDSSGKLDTWELDQFVFKEDNTKVAATGQSSGYVTGYRFNELTKANIDKFIEKRKSEGVKLDGLVLVLEIDPDWNPWEFYYIVGKNHCDSEISLDFAYNRDLLTQASMGIIAGFLLHGPMSLKGFLQKYPDKHKQLDFWTVEELQKMSTYESVQRCNLRLPPSETAQNMVQQRLLNVSK